MKAGIVVIAEISAEGFTPASREVMSFAKHLAESADEGMLVIIPGHFPDISQPPCRGAGVVKLENPPFSQKTSLKNALSCHSGLNPESSNDLKTLDSGFRRNDSRENEIGLLKSLKGEWEGFSYKEAEEIAAAAGCDVAVLVGDHLSAYSAEAWIAALSPVCVDMNPRFICIPHTSRGWDYGPGLAIRLGASLIGAVEGFRQDAGNFFFKRSFLKGQWQMDVLPETWPVVLTILPEAKAEEKALTSGSRTQKKYHSSVVDGKRGGNNDNAPPNASAPPKVSFRTAPTAWLGRKGAAPPRVSFFPIPAKDLRTKPLGRLPATETAYDFSEAEVIVAAGKGTGAVENISLIKRLAGIFPKSAVGCSRAVCDLGWMEYRRQIGMTGRTVAPPLYIACGISGAMPHLAGMRNSRCVIAVNRDKNASIFQVAHLGVVEDLLAFIPAVLELLENGRQESSDD